MQKLTAKEIVTRLVESGVELYDWAYEGGASLESKYLPNHKRLAEIREELGEIRQIAQKGGEGEGDVWFSVHYFPKHDVYLRTDGYYSSYNGVDFYSGFGNEVRPQEKTITVYESA